MRSTIAIILFMIISEVSNGQVFFQLPNEHNFKGNIKSVKQYLVVTDSTGHTADRLLLASAWECDRDGLETERYKTGRSGTVDSMVRYTYKYNNHRDLKEEVVYSKKEGGSKWKKATSTIVDNKYDAQGHLIEAVHFLGWGTGVFKYDGKGHLMEAGLMGRPGTIMKYDEKWNLVQEIYLVGTKWDTAYKSYDEKGFIISTGRDPYKFIYKYEEYDEKGNWLKATQYYRDTPPIRVVRKIEYY